MDNLLNELKLTIKEEEILRNYNGKDYNEGKKVLRTSVLRKARVYRNKRNKIARVNRRKNR